MQFSIQPKLKTSKHLTETDVSIDQAGYLSIQSVLSLFCVVCPSRFQVEIYK